MRCAAQRIGDKLKGEGTIRKAVRAAAFGRRVPLAKLARRVELVLRRRVDRHIGGLARLMGAPPALSERPPTPIFSVRTGKLAKVGDRLRFIFLGQSLETPASAIEWRAREHTASNQLWWMNMHYMEYLEEVDDALFNEIVEQWVRENPPFSRDYWKHNWSSYALSLRVVVLMQQIASRGARMERPMKTIVADSVARQMRFLESNLETDIGGNHLVKNVKALIWASAAFDGPEAGRWRALGLGHLRKELSRQILPDGAHYERSPSYHCQVFADLLECRHALGADPFDGELDDALSRMAQAVADLAHPDGSIALFNDSGLSMAYGPRECLDAYERIFGIRKTPRRVFAFEDAGYYGMRANGAYFIADCGRIGPDDLPAHAHGDILSFEWSVAGRRVVVDQGVFEYVAGERRDKARAATSHNTLCLDGADQADFFGGFRCGRRPNVNIRSYARFDDGFALEGSHDGFRGLSGAPTHVRKFLVDPDGIIIRDRIEGGARAGASLGFLLHPDAQVNLDEGGARISLDGIVIHVGCSLPIEIEDAAWWPDMGREEPTKRLRVRIPSGSGAEVMTSWCVISPFVAKQH